MSTRSIVSTSALPHPRCPALIPLVNKLRASHRQPYQPLHRPQGSYRSHRLPGRSPPTTDHVGARVRSIVRADFNRITLIAGRRHYHAVMTRRQGLPAHSADSRQASGDAGLNSRPASCISCRKHRNDVQIVTGTKAASWLWRTRPEASASTCASAKRPRRRIEQAASVEGKTVSGFIVSSALENAEKTVRRHETMALDREDAMRFFDALAKPPAPKQQTSGGTEGTRTAPSNRGDPPGHARCRTARQAA